MLFDDDEQLEVRHVISLAHHDIGIYSGGDVTPEGELFIKRNALCLARKLTDIDKAPDTQPSKPFYLFSENCSTKEDFYFALLKNQALCFGSTSSTPAPKTFEVRNIISLVQRLHSSEDNANTRWLNAVFGRIFLAVYKTRDMENFVREKITKKIARVKRPSFLTNINIRDINTGDAAPSFTNLKLKDLTVEGECVIEADVKYSGNFRGEVAATAKIDLGTRFKTREVNLVLAVVLKKVEGHVLFKIKPPPSNRIWFSFQAMPKMDMAIEPIVSSRQITYTVILRQIENRIKEVFAETLVQPFWDDLPFFKTEHKKWRGGIFDGDDTVVPSSDIENLLAREGQVEPVDRVDDGVDLKDSMRPMEKSHTAPNIDMNPAEKSGLFLRKVGKTSTGLTAPSSTATSTSGSEGPNGVATAPRSPQLVKNNNVPVVGTNASHADVFKPSTSPPDHATNFMAAIASRSKEPMGGKHPPLERQSTSSSQSSKDDGEHRRSDDDDVSRASLGRKRTGSSAESSTLDVSSSTFSGGSASTRSHGASLGRNLFSRKDDANPSSSSNSINGDGGHKRNTLLAVSNAAAQAKQWGWNAIQRQKEARRSAEGQAQVDLSQPMGRGQPLPPPGTPLPGPMGKLTPSTGTSSQRKPVLASSTTLSDYSAAGSSESVAEHRPPTLPQRRRRGGSQDVEEHGSLNMLVVPMPDDSEPGSPIDDEERGDISCSPTPVTRQMESLKESSLGLGESQLSQEAGSSSQPSQLRAPTLLLPEDESHTDKKWGTYDEKHKVDEDDGLDSWVEQTEASTVINAQKAARLAMSR